MFLEDAITGGQSKFRREGKENEAFNSSVFDETGSNFNPFEGTETFNNMEGDVSPFLRRTKKLTDEQAIHLKNVATMRKGFATRQNPYFAFLNVLGPQPIGGQGQGTPPAPFGVQI